MAKKMMGKREFAVIKLQGRGDEIEPELVPVMVNGVRISLKREEYIPVRAAVVEVLRHAVRPRAKNAEKKNDGNIIHRRKIQGYIQRFPFELVAWVDKPQYDYLRGVAMRRSISEAECFSVIDGEVDLDAAAEGAAA